MPEIKVLKFPKGFLWGAATSAYQVEGGIENNNWALAAFAKRVPAAGLACDHYARWEQDLSLVKTLNHNAHRFSLEWSRIEPQRGEWNEEALIHYHDVLSWLHAQKIKTFITLHHFTDPEWVEKQGGWANRKTVVDFAVYTDKICQRLGHLVDYWITVNEPGIYASMGYLQGKFPPFKKNVFSAWRVYRNLLKAHDAAYRMIHAYYPKAMVGFAQNIVWDEPPRPFRHWLRVNFPYRHTKNDFVGLNHYFYNGRKKTPVSERGWKIYPRALFRVLLDLKPLHLPIYITENGLADAADSQRKNYIHDYLRQVWLALAAGAPVRGYLHWSLVDNFEWEDGYKWKFGLVAVDFKTQKRTIRPSAKYYAEICKDNAIK